MLGTLLWLKSSTFTPPFSSSSTPICIVNLSFLNTNEKKRKHYTVRRFYKEQLGSVIKLPYGSEAICINMNVLMSKGCCVTFLALGVLCMMTPSQED